MDSDPVFSHDLDPDHDFNDGMDPSPDPALGCYVDQDQDRDINDDPNFRHNIDLTYINPQKLFTSDFSDYDITLYLAGI